MQTRTPPQISTGSMADIAFLLLVFFFVCTTISEDQGILVILPPFEESPPIDIPEKNLFKIHINGNNEILARNSIIDLELLADQLKLFIMNPMHRKEFPSSPKKALVSFKCDRHTEYATYLQVYNEIKSAYHQLWDNAAERLYKKPYRLLEKREQKSIRDAIPMVISEAELSDFASM